jgi:hypothetical protein
MNTDRIRHIRRLTLPGAVLALSACTQGFATGDHPVAEFGEANRQTMMAQVVNPEPHYDTLVPVTSADQAADAVDRYNTGQVKQPPSITTSDLADD